MHYFFVTTDYSMIFSRTSKLDMPTLKMETEVNVGISSKIEQKIKEENEEREEEIEGGNEGENGVEKGEGSEGEVEEGMPTIKEETEVRFILISNNFWCVYCCHNHYDK